MRQFNVAVMFAPHPRRRIDWVDGEARYVEEAPRTRDEAVADGLRIAREQGALADEMVWEDTAEGVIQGHCPWPEAES